MPGISGWGSAIFGQKPKVPPLAPIDINKVQQQAIEADLAALPAASELAGAYNKASQQELDQMLAAKFPDLAAAEGSISKNLASLTAGEIPADVQAQIERHGAAAALAGGYAGSGAGRNLVARDLGLTSLNLTQAGMDATSRWLATTRNYLMAPQFNISSMFFSPQQRLAQVTEERNTQWERLWLANQVSAMPNPAAHATWEVIHQIGMMALGMEMGQSAGSQSQNDIRYQQAPQGGLGGGFAGGGYAGGMAGGYFGGGAGMSGGVGGFSGGMSGGMMGMGGGGYPSWAMFPGE